MNLYDYERKKFFIKVNIDQIRKYVNSEHPKEIIYTNIRSDDLAQFGDYVIDVGNNVMIRYDGYAQYPGSQDMASFNFIPTEYKSESLGGYFSKTRFYMEVNPMDKKRPETRHDLTLDVIAERKKLLKEFFEKDKWYVQVWDDQERGREDVDEAIYDDFIGPFDSYAEAASWIESVGFKPTNPEDNDLLRKGERRLRPAAHTGQQFIDRAEHNLRHWKPTKIVNPNDLSESKYLAD